MKFYSKQHKYYCSIDLHARKMYVCIIDQKGKTKVHQNIKTDPELFFELIFLYLDDVAVGVECVFCWYWLADVCNMHKIPFVLGHALYMKAIHGGKTKNDRIDSYKIASLLKGGNFPTTYPYPAKWRATRDLMRRRMYISSKKIGNHHLKWAIKEAAILMLRDSSQAKNYVAKYERKYNKGKALGIFTHKLGRAIYFMLKNKEAFDMKQFFGQ